MGLGERVLTGDSPASWYPFQVLATTTLILELPLRRRKTTIQDLIKVIILLKGTIMSSNKFSFYFWL
jgi:hypothetical protein